MLSSNSLDVRRVDAAVADAISGAQWERIDLQTRRSGHAPGELMLAKAAELAMSPVARDQLMSVALEHGAWPCRSDLPVIDIDCSARERSLISDRIHSLGPHRVCETDAVVLEIEERHVRGLRPDARLDRLADGLEQDAVLQEAFWDHPIIPAADSVRLTMLGSIPRLRDRAEILSSSGRLWWSPVRRWFGSLSRRGTR